MDLDVSMLKLLMAILEKRGKWTEIKIKIIVRIRGLFICLLMDLIFN